MNGSVSRHRKHHTVSREMKIFSLCIFIMLSVTSTSLLSRRLARRFSFPRLSMAVTSALTPSSSDVIAMSHPAYEIKENTVIDEYGVKAVLYSHKKSGAQVMSIISPDDNKVFGITFRTPPSDSTGIPHILEHSVLCGSRKFPVKEPFVDLLKGSLQNFLNAFTYPDRTCYPVASTNTKDFYNLIHVYLDAVLHPRAIDDPQVLQQEGWHYELEDSTQPLTFKGVVYNEMKGVYSSPDSLMGRATQQALFPDNTYGVDSGGDPVDIPNLTFKQFKEFHQSYYHPSNSRIFFYGNDDPLKRLSLLDDYLSEFDRISVTSEIKYQSLRLKPTKIAVKFPVAPPASPDAPAEKHMVTVNWLLNDKPFDAKESLALGVLDYLLLGTSSSVLRKKLTESQLGESVTGGGLSDELLQATFGAGLKGVKEENVAAVEELVLSSLAEIANKGFEDDAIKAAMNTIEFRLREFNTGSFPRGLSLMLGMISHWIYDKPPTDGVRFEKPLQELKADLAAGKPVFQDLMRKYIIFNDHRITVEMKPDADLETEMTAEEVSRLAQVKEGLSTKEIEDIIEATKVLKAAQMAEDSPEARASIPRLTLADIERKARELPIEVVQDGKAPAHKGVAILTHDLPSNGILYLDLALDYSGIDHDDLPLLPLFSRMMTESGTGLLDDVALSRKIGSETGGISTSFMSDMKHSPVVIPNVPKAEDVTLYFLVRGKAVRDNVPKLFDLVTDVLLNAKLDNQKRAVEMLKESKVRKEASVITSGHTYGASRLAARHSFLGYLGEVTGGLTSVRHAGGLLEAAEKDWPSVLKRLLKIRDTIVKKGSVVVNLTGDSRTLEAAKTALPKLLDPIPEHTAGSAKKSILDSWETEMNKRLLPVANEGFVMPSQVNYVCKGGPIMFPGEKVSGSTSVVSRYLGTGYLWDNVRVVGGAYGGFARFSDVSGRIVFMSYRDPNLVNTLRIYDGAASALEHAGKEMQPADLLQAVIGTVGDLDGPMSPDQEGFASFARWVSGESPESRQQWRDEVLDTSASDFHNFAEKLKKLEETGSVVVFGSAAAIEQAQSEIAGFKVEPAILPQQPKSQ